MTSRAPCGAILGTVELVDRFRDYESPWAVPGAWPQGGRQPNHWAKPIPMNGRLGLWTVAVAS